MDLEHFSTMIFLSVDNDGDIYGVLITDVAVYICLDCLSTLEIPITTQMTFAFFLALLLHLN